MRVLPGKGNRPVRHYVIQLPVLCMRWKRYRAGSAALLQMRALLRHGGYQDVNVHCMHGKRRSARYGKTHPDMPHMPWFRRRPVEPGDVLPAMPWKWGSACLRYLIARGFIPRLACSFPRSASRDIRSCSHALRGNATLGRSASRYRNIRGAGSRLQPDTAGVTGRGASC